MAAPEAPPVDPPVEPPPAPPKTPEQRPDNIPEKFWDPTLGQVKLTELLNSYSEAEKRISELSEPAKKPDTPPAKAEGGLKIPAASDKPALADDADVSAILTAAGLDPVTVVSQYAQNKTLTDAQYTALKKLGYTRGIVNQFLGMQTTLQAQAQATIKTHAVERAGGEKQLENLLQWAGQGLSAEEQKMFNAQLANPATAIMAVESLMTRHQIALGAGKAQPLLEGEGGAATAGAFKTQRELTAAMADSRYGMDSTYTEQVNRRIGVSPEAHELPVS